MNETGGNISLEDGKTAKDGNEIADCIEQFTGISISPPVKTIETALHNLQIAESEGETKEESVSNLGNGALPEQTPNSSKTPTSVESSKSDVTVNILEDGKASPDEQSGSDHNRSKVSEGGQIEGRTLKEECKPDRDDAKGKKWVFLYFKWGGGGGGGGLLLEVQNYSKISDLSIFRSIIDCR